MARPNAGEPTPPNSLSPFQPPAGPYGPLPGAVPSSSPATSGPTPVGLLHALKRRWVLASFVGGLVAAAAAAAVWTLLPAGKHQGRALVQLRSNGPEITARSAEEFENFRRNQMFILRTRDLLNRTVNEPAVGSLDMVKGAEDPIRVLEEALKVDVAAPDILAVTLTGDNPDDIKTVLDMLVRKYIDDATAYERAARDTKIKKLEALAEKIQGEIHSKEKSIQVMVEANSAMGGEGAGAKHARMQQELAKLDADVFTTTREVQALESNITVILNKIKDKRFDLDPLELAFAVNSDPRMADLLRQKATKEFFLARDKEKIPDPANPPPSITLLEEEIENLTKQIAAARKVVEPELVALQARVTEQQLRNKAVELKDQLDSKRALLATVTEYRDKYQKGITQAIKGDFSATNLLKELEPQKEMLAKINTQLAQARVDRDMDSRVTIREAASVTLNQNLKQKSLLATAAGLAGLCLVLVVVGFLEWRTRRIDGVDQVVTELRMRVIGTVPLFPNKASLKAADAAGNANWRFALNESINSTRTMLLHTARAQAMQVVMVTSATQGEGKTSLASQLGSSMATAGMRTLIVDCDLRNPSIHKLFDLGLTAGVSEVLCQEVDVADAVQPTAVPNLWVIPAGQCSTRVISALAQGHPLETLLNRLRGQFDFIIVDSCPVLPVADALLIGQHVDGVVFSIMQDISQLPKVAVASEKLQQLNIPLLGAVVNGVSSGSSYYAYGYNYVKQLPA